MSFTYLLITYWSSITSFWFSKFNITFFITFIIFLRDHNLWYCYLRTITYQLWYQPVTPPNPGYLQPRIWCVTVLHHHDLHLIIFNLWILSQYNHYIKILFLNPLRETYMFSIDERFMLPSSYGLMLNYFNTIKFFPFHVHNLHWH